MIDELPEGPDPANDTPQSFSQKAAAMVLAQRAMVPQINQAVAEMNSLQAGGAYALPYIFDTATADADPGAGKLRLSSATQSASTVMRLDLTAGGQDYTTLIDTMDGSTSTIKGSIRLVKQGDLSKWMTFDVTARAAPSGYRNLTVVCTDSSSASPFAAGDALMLFFQRNGDRGETGVGVVALLAASTVSSAVTSIDYLNIFNSTYDRYTIELQGMRGATGPETISMQLAVAGVAQAGSYAVMATPGTESSVAGSVLQLGNVTQTLPSQAASLTIEVRNANATTLKSVGIRGISFSIPANSMICNIREGGYGGANPVSGFRVFFSGAGIAAGAVIRIYGHRNNP